MKTKYIIISLVLLILIIGGYFIYTHSFQVASKYRNTLHSELNPSDYHTPGNQVKEIAESYSSGQDFYRVSIMQFSDESTATAGITKLKDTYNPGMIGLNKKYVNYVNMSGLNYYFYQSGKYIITIDFSGDKDLGDSFVIWYYSKYKNQ